MSGGVRINIQNRSHMSDRSHKKKTSVDEVLAKMVIMTSPPLLSYARRDT